MKLLAIDIGFVTQDILLFDEDKDVENCIKMVLPSPTYLMAEKIREAGRQRKDVFLSGGVMGGGHITRAVKEHIKMGLNVYATPDAALTFKDDLEKVRKMGVHITSTPPNGAVHLELSDLNIEMFERILSQVDEAVPPYMAVAVQDHGFSLGSNRDFRFSHLKKIIEEGGDINKFVYFENIPSYLTRMKRIQEDVHPRKCVVMDTGPAAIFGCLVCDDISCEDVSSAIVINVGNGHTLGASVVDGRVVGIFEHHTHLLSPRRIDELIDGLMNGELSHEDIKAEGGHGAYILENVDDAKIFATGPNRYLLRECTHEVSFPAPFGDMMLTGCFGLLKGASVKLGFDFP